MAESDPHNARLGDARLVSTALAYMVRASEVLGMSVDRGHALQELARLAVPLLGDYTIIDTLSAEGEVVLAGLAHVRPEDELLLREYRRLYPPDAQQGRSPVLQAIRSRQPVVQLSLPEDFASRQAMEPTQLELLRRIHPRAFIIVPLLRFGQALGSMSFCLNSPDRTFEQGDVDVATTVADRVASVVYYGALIDRAERSRDDALALGERLKEQAQELDFSNHSLQEQAVELEQQVEEAQALSEELEETVEALRTSETRFRALIDASATAVWQADPDGVVRIASPSWEKMTGTRMHIPRRDGQPSVVHPDDAEATTAAWQAAIAASTPYAVRHRIRVASGAYRWFLASAVPVYDENRSTIREWVGMHTDMHDQRVADDEQRLLLEISTVLQNESDGDRMVQSVLRRLVSFLGVSHARVSEIDVEEGLALLVDAHVVYAGEEAVYRPATSVRRVRLVDVSTDLERQRAGEPLIVTDTLTDQRTASSYKGMFEPNGTRAMLSVPLMRAGRWTASLSVSASAPRAWTARESNFIRAVGARLWPAFEAARAFAELAQARREAERRLQHSQKLAEELAATNADLAQKEGRLAGIIGAAMDAIVSIDSQGRIIVFNTAAERVFGAPASEVLGGTIDRFLPAHFRGAHQDDAAHLEATGETARRFGYIGEVTAHRADGTEFPAEASIAHVETEAGDLSTVVLRDVTERRALEAQLVHAHKMEAVGQLAGGVAHDFNNILMVIRSCADFLRDSLEGTDERIHDIDEVIVATDRAAALTRQLLAFSRKQMLVPRVVSMQEVVNGIQSMLRRLISEDIEIAVLAHSLRDTVRADVGQLEQVILNLAVNARDAMKRGGLLTIETDEIELTPEDIRTYALSTSSPVQQEQPGSYVMLRVSDTGSGIDPAVQGRIFEPFFTTKGEGHGTGLGLATVHGIAGQSGGYVRVRSTLNVGTSFEVLLPRVREGPTGEFAVAAPARGKVESACILLAEDEATVRRSVRRMLDRAGFKVLEARHGADALMVLAEHGDAVDLLITDLRMPELGGHELIATLRARMPDLPVIAMSGYPPERDAEPEWQGLDEVEFLSKPFSTEMLMDAVRRALGRS